MRIALAQLNPLVGDLEGNARLILDSAKEAEKLGADLVITPELSLWGYPPKDLLLQPSQRKKQNKILDKLSKEVPASLNILVGTCETNEEIRKPNQFNSVALVSSTSWKIVARKRLLPTYDVFDEKRYFRPSNQSWLLKFPCSGKVWRIGLTVCEDLWVNDDIHIYRTFGNDPVGDFEDLKPDLLVNLSASPFSQGKVKLRRELTSSAAKRLTCPVIYVNQVGGNDELIFDGGSFVTDKNGKVQKQLKFAECDLQVWDTDKRNLESIDSNIYINHSADDLLLRSLTLGLKDYCYKCNFSKVLIGLSGGIDSALVSLIAVAALGADNVQALLMPSPWSSEGSITDAKALAKRLRINKSIVPIEGLMNEFNNALNPVLGKQPWGLAAENLQSRIRGTLLMGLANQQGQLLLTTGNKSELAVGYCTLYGDMNGGLGVIGDLYKTTVFRLCSWVDSQQAGEFRKKYGLLSTGELIGFSIREKPPSAELRPKQLDCDSLPDYEILDPILKALIEKHKAYDDLVAEGIESELAQKIHNLLRKSEFKRKQSAPTLKVSQRAFGSGWRMPIAASN